MHGMTDKGKAILTFHSIHPEASQADCARALGITLQAVKERCRTLRHKGQEIKWGRTQTIAKGTIRRQGLVTLTLSLPEDLFEEIRARAVKAASSFTSQAILLMEWGLEAEKDSK